MEEERRKVYVEVDVTHKTDGTALFLPSTNHFPFSSSKRKVSVPHIITV